MKKKLLIIGVAITCFAFTNENFTLKGNLDYIETINTLEDLQEWIAQDIKNGQVNQVIGETYLENIDECLSRLEDLELKTK
tara:strand:- start:1360 stop:1602 length:243 start_codon:yes stop_codon:yes gene_type:complete